MTTVHRHSSETRADGSPGTARSSPVGAVARYSAAAVRLSMGWVFLWAFLDKLFGLGHETAEQGRLDQRRQPHQGLPRLRRHGPVQGLLQRHRRRRLGRLAVHDRPARHRHRAVLGIAMRVAAAAGVLLLVLMWTAVLPPANNPFMDDHLIYAMVLVLITALGAGHTWGLGRTWESLALVRRTPWLR